MWKEREVFRKGNIKIVESFWVSTDGVENEYKIAYVKTLDDLWILKCPSHSWKDTHGRIGEKLYNYVLKTAPKRFRKKIERQQQELQDSLRTLEALETS
jgi:hypothetical protein